MERPEFILKELEWFRGYSPDAASVDKIDPTKGYTKGNVRVISSRANLLKNNATVEELRKVLEDLERISV